MLMIHISISRGGLQPQQLLPLRQRRVLTKLHSVQTETLTHCDSNVPAPTVHAVTGVDA